MAGIGNFPAGVLLQANMSDMDLTSFIRHPTVNTDNSGALETGRDGTVEILLARYVKFIHDGAIQEHGQLQGNLQRLLIDRERRGIVHLVCTAIFTVKLISHVLFGFELHQGGAVVLAKLRKRRPHMADDLTVRSVITVTRWATAI